MMSASTPDTHCYQIIENPDGQLSCKWMPKDAPPPPFSRFMTSDPFPDFTSAMLWMRSEKARDPAYYAFLARAARYMERQERGY